MTPNEIPEAAPAIILIVGAGPTGLTLACDLARRDVSFRIVDAAAEPFLGSRGKGIQPRTLEVLADLGVVEAILAAGAEYPPFRLHWWRRFTLGGWNMHKHAEPSADVPYANTWMVPQSRTEAILRERLGQLGHAVEFGVRLTALEQEPGAVTAVLAGPGSSERVRCSYLVGADGGRSTVRGLIGISFAGTTAEAERMVICDVEVDGLDRQHWHVWPLASGGVLTLCPLPGTPYFQLSAKLAAGVAAPALTEPGIQEFVAQKIGRHAGVHIHSPRWTSVWRYNARMVDRYRVGRVFLAGDAAHVHPPMGGQGLNTGVQDANNLGWKLAQVLAGAPASLLDTYESERLPIAAAVLDLSTRLYAQSTKQSIRGQRRGAATQQLGLHYRGGPLSHELRARPGALQAGDRAPDATCQDAAGRPVRLFDAFRGPHFTLLAFGDGHAGMVTRIDPRHAATLRILHIVPPRAACGEHDLRDDLAQARTAYDVSDDALVLVRPDGYIGLFAEPGSAQQLEAYLDIVTAASQPEPPGHWAEVTAASAQHDLPSPCANTAPRKNG